MACAKCGLTSQSLQKCGGCRIVQYCSRDCQRQHWRAEHKHECIRRDRADPTTSVTVESTASNVPAPMRSTFRMNWRDLQRMTTEGTDPAARLTDPADTVYYLMTAIQALNDRTCMGPFHIREAFIPSLTNKIQQVAGPTGVSSLTDWLDQAGGPEAFINFTITMPDVGNHRLEVWLHKERNSQVQQALPCPTWKLVYLEVANQEESLVAEGAGQLKDMQVHGTYLTQAEAEAAGAAVASRVLRNGQGGIQEMNVPGEGRIWVRGRDPTRFVQVSYDDGVDR